MLELFRQCGICFSFHFHDFFVDGILVWDVYKIMASSNRLMECWFGMCTKLWRAQTGWWNVGLGCAQTYGELKPVDGILVWDVHKIMASPNRMMEFWFGMCTNLLRAQTGSWNSGLGCAQNYGELQQVDGILVWDMHKIMASSNRSMEFWFGMCTK